LPDICFCLWDLAEATWVLITSCRGEQFRLILRKIVRVTLSPRLVGRSVSGNLLYITYYLQFLYPLINFLHIWLECSHQEDDVQNRCHDCTCLKLIGLQLKVFNTMNNYIDSYLVFNITKKTSCQVWHDSILHIL
jgi:hypothetical protein